MNAPQTPAERTAIRQAHHEAAAMVRAAAGRPTVTPADVDTARRLRDAVRIIDAMLIDARNLARTSPLLFAAAASFEGARQSLGTAFWRITESDAAIGAALDG